MALLRENYFKIHFALWRFAGCVETFNHILALSGQRGFTSAHLLDNLWRVVNWFLPKFPPPFVLWYLIVVMKFVYGLVELVHIMHLEWQHKREMQQILHTTIIVITIITTITEIPILWPHDEKNRLIGKDPDVGKDWRQEEKGTTEDEMLGWHHQLNGNGFEQAPRVGDGQGSLACCSPWGHKELDMIEWLKWMICCQKQVIFIYSKVRF